MKNFIGKIIGKIGIVCLLLFALNIYNTKTSFAIVYGGTNQSLKKLTSSDSVEYTRCVFKLHDTAPSFWDCIVNGTSCASSGNGLDLYATVGSFHAPNKTFPYGYCSVSLSTSGNVKYNALSNASYDLGGGNFAAPCAGTSNGANSNIAVIDNVKPNNAQQYPWSNYTLQCKGAPVDPVYYCEAKTNCPTGVVGIADRIIDAPDQNSCCPSGKKLNTTTGNCDTICTPVNAVMSAWSACVAPVDTTKGNQTRTLISAASCGGAAAGALSQSCVAPLICSTGNVPNATRDACVPCPTDTNYSSAAGGTCSPQCTGLLENQVCFKTSQTVTGGLSELFQLNKNAEGYTSPNVHSCFKAGVVDFTPVAKTDLDYGRKFNISCGKIANAITSGATTAVDNGSVRDINAVVR